MLIKHYGNIIKVYASSIASLFAAWVSQALLKDPPPALFYAGVCLAMAASVQLQRARGSLSGSADAGAGHSHHHSSSNKSPRRNGQQPQQHHQHHLHQRVKASVAVPVVLALLVLVFVPQMIPWSRDWVNLQRGQASGSSSSSSQAAAAAAAAAAANGTVSSSVPQLPANLNNPASLMPQGGIDAPFPALPPFEPACLVRFEDRAQLGCRPVNCSLAASCTVQDKSCCAYLNFRMLHDLDRILYSKGLQGEYALVYGSALGAARNQSVLPDLPNIDMSFSPTAVQVMAQNSTREQLWRQGYVFWHDTYMWRLCPHDQHPASEFRAAMVTNMTHPQWQGRTGSAAAVWMDGYLMWKRPIGASSCATRSADPESAAQAAILMQPLSPTMSAAARAVHTPQEQHPELGQAAAAASGGGAAERSFCLQQSHRPILIQSGERPAPIASLAFPAPHNMKE